MRVLWLFLALIASSMAHAASEAPQNVDAFYLTVESWKGMTFSVNVIGDEVLYRCALYGDEAFTRSTAFSANQSDVRRLFDSLAKLGVTNWKPKYISSMADGEGWYLMFEVNGTRREFVGSNAQPKELPGLVDSVALFLGKLPFGFSGAVPYSKQAEDCLRLKQPLRNYTGIPTSSH
ncbi:MAG TPA: hypothetical protein VKH64_09020 [Candidatus Binatia bacterium]|nr:hypothetical protein [Candidatus Binatia bacterium]